MSPEAVLQAVDDGRIPPATIVFPYRAARAALSLAATIGVGLLFAGTAGLFFATGSPGLGAGALITVAGAAFMALGPLRGLRSARTNMIVVTPDGVIRRLAGRTRVWPFRDYTARADVKGLRWTIWMVDQRRAQDELVGDATFGRGEQIYQAIQHASVR